MEGRRGVVLPSLRHPRQRGAEWDCGGPGVDPVTEFKRSREIQAEPASLFAFWDGSLPGGRKTDRTWRAGIRCQR